MHYISTRGGCVRHTASQAITNGIADDGGLYIPDEIPLSELKINSSLALNYNEHALWLLMQYFTDYEPSKLIQCIDNAYNTITFDTPIIAPLVEMPDVYFLELFHGMTLAFKDMALSLLPHLMSEAVNKERNPITQVILTATSGDTGVATLEAFKNVERIKIIVFYPEDGVSVVQKKQMITQNSNNAHVVGIKGNFDEVQKEVKRIFLDKSLNKNLNSEGFKFTSANSINIGRLIPQITYYYYAYTQMVKNGLPAGEAISFIVPTGNFGNILAGYYAKKMGLPIHKLICACNENNVLHDFFHTGVFDSNRPLVLTSSPSMDILLPSNFERLIYNLIKPSNDLNEQLVKLSCEGRFKLDKEVEDFVGRFASELEVKNAIKKVYNKYGYLIDPHTAVAYVAFEKYRGHEKCVIVSTASPYKFAKSVMGSIDPKYKNYDDFALFEQISALRNENIPAQIANLKERDIIHDAVVEVREMQDVVLRILNLNRK